MADHLGFIENITEDVFNAESFDEGKARKQYVKLIERTKTQFASTEPQRGKQDWSINNGFVRYEPRINGNPVAFIVKPGDSRDVVFIKTENFASFLDGLRDAVNAGDYDDSLEEAVTSETGTMVARSSTTAAPTRRRSGTSKPKGSGFPYDQHPGADKLGAQDRRNLGRLWSLGRNPDHSLRAEVGDKPDAKYAGSMGRKK